MSALADLISSSETAPDVFDSLFEEELDPLGGHEVAANSSALSGGTCGGTGSDSCCDCSINRPPRPRLSKVS